MPEPDRRNKGTYSVCAERTDRTVTVKIRKGKA